MAYLEDVLKSTERSKARRSKTNNNIALVTAIAAQRSAIAESKAAPRPVPQAQPTRSPVGRTAGAKGGGPHTAGDGHNHGSGGQSVGEANELWRRLQNMIKDRPTIKPGARARSYDEQVRLWNLYKAGKGAMAARPGTSKHGNGRANDLKYGNDSDRQWALANAKNYGLAFPLYNPKLGRGRDESWHIELAR